MQGLMMDVPLSLPAILRRTDAIFGGKPLAARRADRTIARGTYSEVLYRARKLAAGLESLGIRPGDRVATFCWNHLRHLEAYYGIPASGRVLHTLNIRLHIDELAYIIDHAGDAAIIVDKSLWSVFAPLRDRIAPMTIIVVSDDGEAPDGTIDYEQLCGTDPSGIEFADLPESAAAVMCYTSGTTGKPKGVVYSHRSMVLHSLAECLPDCLGLGETDVVLAVVPMFHANAWGLPYACALVGATQVMPGPHLDPASLIELFQSEAVTVTAGVPTIWHGLLKHLDQTGTRLATVRQMIVGGAAIPEATIRAFDERHGLKVVHAWGMTETSPLGSVSRVPHELLSAPDIDQFAWRATQGRPAPFVEIRARGEHGLTPWDGVTMGELEVRGPWVSSAYHDSPESSDRWTDDGWFKTGDIVSIGPTGGITIQDRSKDLVKSGGEWISTVALESALANHPDVAEVVVVAVPHAQWGERPLAVAVARPGCTPTIESVRAHLAPHVAKWWLPDAVVLVDSLPKTGTGKYQKHQVRAMFKDAFSPASTA